MDPLDPDNPQALLHPEGVADFATLAECLIESARERVRILPQRVDLRYLVNPAVVTALRELALQRRRARVELLLHPGLARDGDGLALWNLAARLPSSFTVHCLADEQASFSEALLTVDTRGYLHRSQPDRLRGSACLNDAAGTRDMNQRFEELWLASAPDPDARRLSL